MSFRDLRSFLNELRQRKDLVEISVEVDPKLEIAEIHRRVIEQGGPALLFRNPKNSRFPIVTNLFGTLGRTKLAFGSHVQEFVATAAKLPHELLPPSFSGIWNHRRFFQSAIHVGTKRVKDVPVLDVIQSPPRLGDLPALTTWSLDGGPFITLPLVYTEHPQTGVHNLGMYRMQIFDDATTGMHFQIGKGGGFHLAAAAELKQKLPVNVAIGGPPALILAAICPLPENVPELIFASVVLGERFRLAKSPLSPLPFAADAEFILSGYVDPNERRPEGPFGDHYGYYSLTHDFPVFHCTSVSRRKDAIYPATVVGKPRQEDFFIGDFLQETLAPLFPLVMPSVRDLWSYGETGYHSLAGAVVRERYAREAMVSAFRILGEGQLSLTKFLLLTDQAIDLRDFRSVLIHVLERADFRTDLYLFGQLSMDTLDYTGPSLNRGSKGVLAGVGASRWKLATEFRGERSDYLSAVRVFCPGCLIVSGASHAQDPRLAERVAADLRLTEGHDGEFRLIVLSDNAEITAASTSRFLWETFTRFEPAADIFARRVELIKNHPSFHAPIVIDARMKGSYPDELVCDPETAELVDKRWKNYNLQLN